MPDGWGGGVAALAVTGVVARLIDFGYRVALVRLAGPELVGVFRVIFPIFGTLSALVGGGIPPAVANLVARKHKTNDDEGVRRVVQLGLYLTAALGAGMALAVMFAARWLADVVVHEPRVASGLLAIAPALAIVPVSSVFRAYFQGTARLVVPAWSQLVEELAQVTAGLGLVYLMAPRGPAAIVAAMGASVTMSELAGLMVMQAAYRLPPAAASWGDDFSYILRFALPMTASRVLGSISGSVSALLVPARLTKQGYTHSAAMSLYGQLTGMAGTVASFPVTISFAVVYAMVPQVAASASSPRRRAKAALERAIGLTAMVALPAMVVMTLAARPLMKLFFGDTAGSQLLVILALASPMSHLDMVMTSALQALGKPGVAFRNFLLGEALNLGGIWLCTGRPQWGVAGVALAGAVATAVEAVFDYMAVNRVIGRRVSLAGALRPAAYAAGLGLLLVFWRLWS